MNLNLASGRVVRTLEKRPSGAVMRWDLMRPVAAPPKPPAPVARMKAVGHADKIVIRREPPLPNPIPVAVRKVVPEVLRMVANVTGGSLEALRGPSRQAELVRARQIACYLARGTGASFPAIGRDMGGKDHTTVLHGFRRVEATIEALGLDAAAPAECLAAELWQRRAEWPKAI